MSAGQRKNIDDLLAVMSALREPGTGCPWDQEQTFATIAPYTIEEAYEVADAIARGDMGDLKDELGDLLLQVVYHAQMGQETKAFSFAEVVDGIVRKMVRRHPHVFGDAKIDSEEELRDLWDRVKAEEKAARGSEGKAGVLADVATGLPALSRAIKLQRAAAKVGFDWPGPAPVLEKIREELAELEAAMQKGSARSEIVEEYGDLIFVLANLARHLNIDPEAALRSANAKFVRRFERVERLLAEQGGTPQTSNLEEMERLWQRAKREEK